MVVELSLTLADLPNQKLIMDEPELKRNDIVVMKRPLIRQKRTLLPLYGAGLGQAISGVRTDSEDRQCDRGSILPRQAREGHAD